MSPAEELVESAPGPSLSTGTDDPPLPPAPPDVSEAGARARSGWMQRALSPDTSLHQSLLSLVDQGVASATNFITGVIIARSCPKDELGLYMLGFTLVYFMTDLQTSLITTPYMVYSPRLKGRAHALYTGSTLIHQTAFCLLTMVGIALGALAVEHGLGNPALAPVLWALVWVMALMMLREHARRVSFARLQLRTALLFDTGIALAQLVGLLLLAHLHLLKASRAYGVIGVCCGLAVAAWLWWDRRFYEPRFRQALADLRKNWVLGKWVFASGLIWAIGMNLYPWLLAAFHGVSAAGIWAACVGVISVINPIMLGIQNLVGPKIAHTYAARGGSALHRLVLQISAGIGVPMLLLCLLMYFEGGRFAVLLYGKPYAGHGTVVALLAFNLLWTSLAFPFSRALFALGRARVDFLVNFTSLFLMLTAGLWLVRRFGPLGAALGLVISSVVAASVRAAAFLRNAGSSAPLQEAL